MYSDFHWKSSIFNLTHGIVLELFTEASKLGPIFISKIKKTPNFPICQEGHMSTMRMTMRTDW